MIFYYNILFVVYVTVYHADTVSITHVFFHSFHCYDFIEQRNISFNIKLTLKNRCSERYFKNPLYSMKLHSRLNICDNTRTYSLISSSVFDFLYIKFHVVSAFRMTMVKSNTPATKTVFTGE